MIHVLTLSHGREKYLRDLCGSLRENSGLWPNQWVHWIQFQGWYPEGDAWNVILWARKAKARPCVMKTERIGIAEGIKAWLEHAGSEIGDDDLVVKLDEDALVHSEDFLWRAEEIHGLWPRLAFHAFPVGIKGFMEPSAGYQGGVHVWSAPPAVDPAQRYITGQSKHDDLWYALLRAPFLGGLARICPAWMMKECTWEGREEPGNCDAFFATYCLERNLPMAYCMNALVVEHNESVAQRLRYPQPEFRGTEHKKVDL